MTDSGQAADPEANRQGGVRPADGDEPAGDEVDDDCLEQLEGGVPAHTDKFFGEASASGPDLNNDASGQPL